MTVRDSASDPKKPTYVCNESAAVGFARLGNVYHKVLKMEQRANGLYLFAIQYADIVTHTSGATYFRKEWYKATKAGLEEIRRRREAFDNAAMAAERAPALERLQPRLDAIVAAMEAFESKAYKAHALLKFLHANERPPGAVATDEPFQLNRDDKEEMKKGIRAGVAIYCQVKMSNKTHGVDWQVLCGEIMKHLNGCSEVYK